MEATSNRRGVPAVGCDAAADGDADCDWAERRDVAMTNGNRTAMEHTARNITIATRSSVKRFRPTGMSDAPKSLRCGLNIAKRLAISPSATPEHVPAAGAVHLYRSYIERKRPHFRLLGL